MTIQEALEIMLGENTVFLTEEGFQYWNNGRDYLTTKECYIQAIKSDSTLIVCTVDHDQFDGLELKYITQNKR